MNRGPEVVISYPGKSTTRKLDVVRLNQQLVRIPSDNGTTQIVNYMQDLASARGLETVKIPIVGQSNMDSLLVGKGIDRIGSLLAVAHIDTFANWAEGQHHPLSGDIADGYLYGRGSSDSKGSAAAMFSAAINRLRDMPANFGLLFPSDEEHELRGIQAAARYFEEVQAKTGSKSPRIMIGGGSDQEYGYGSRGVLEANVTVAGGGGHGAFGITGPDSIDVSNDFIGHLRQVVDRVPEDPTLGRVTLTRGGLVGGFYGTDSAGNPQILEKVNYRPDRARTTFSLRLNGQQLDGQDLTHAVVRDMIRSQVEQNPGMSVVGYHEGAHIEGAITDKSRSKWVVDLAEQVTGRSMTEIEYKVRGLDETLYLLNVFNPQEMGFVYLGPGEKAVYHKPDERVSIEALRNYDRIYGEVFTDSRLK